ncbi:WASH complex subunit 3 [Leguminivora glycinivorella]|uniref:WASH complex subunit 3 n=1 Tax=Leguminivora glycinivorella TaxID=1035111 RepID=UPI00200F90BE|nr:WASH complex subunit 3 [Leguminivora glycinivorella]
MSLQGPTVGHDINNVDLSKIAGLQQKRTLAFVNHFLVTTVQFLNKFTKDCEEKLMNFELKLEKVNATMVLLEAKLSSIPEVSIQSQCKTEDPQQDTNAGKPDHIPVDSTEPSQNTNPETSEGSDTTATKEVGMEEASVAPEYMRFVKMVQVGVPLQAVKLKLTMEGLDPNVFDRVMNK